MQQATADPRVHRRHSYTQRQVWLSLCGAPGSWSTQGFVWALQTSPVGMGFDSKCNFAPPTILLGLWMRGIFVCVCGIQHSPVDGHSAASCNSGVLTGEDAHIPLFCHIVVLTTNCGNFLKIWECQFILPASWETCKRVKKQQLELDMKQPTGSKLGKEYLKATYYHPACLTYMQSTSWKCQTRWSSCWNQDCWKKPQ